ncbi:MAG: hypothetical protein KKA31_02400 [Candidatus Margulisbacteria bacterium]|nr:hypothetical protein [Candidatus Margulisiibacteriota bacterium]
MHSSFGARHFKERISTLPEADVYIFDEIHHAFPRSDDGQSILARIAGYSALHPEHRLYRSFLYCQTSTEIQTAPLVELEN